MTTRQTVFALLAFSVAFSAIAEIDFPIADPDLHAAEGEQTSPSVAGSGHDFLSAWADGRARVGSLEELDVYAARIELDGRVDPGGGAAVAPTFARDNAPSIVWNGREYVAIQAQSSWPWEPVGGVMFSRINDAGPGPGTLVPFGTDVVAPYGARVVAAWNGSEYLVVLGRNGPDRPTPPQTAKPNVIRAFIADADFHMLCALIEVSDPTIDSILPAVATDGSSFLVTWQTENHEVWAVGVSRTGAVERRAEPVAAFTPINFWFEGYWPPATAWNGQQYLVTWSEGSSIEGRFLDAHGAAAGDRFTIARTDPVAVFAPAVAWNGSVFLVSFAYRNDWPQETTNLYAARLSPTGVLIDQPYPLTIVVKPGDQTVSAVAASGTRFVVVWEDEGDIRSAVVDGSTGTVTGAELVSRSLANQSNGVAVFNGNDVEYLWTEQSDVLFGRMTVAGDRLDGAGRKVGSGVARALVWNGNISLAVWQPEPGLLMPLRAGRISGAGQPMDTTPLTLPEGGQLFAANGTDFLVVTSQSFPGNGSLVRSRLASYVVTAGGDVTQAEPVLAAEFSQIPVSLTSNGSSLLLVYKQYFGEACLKCFAPFKHYSLLLDPQGRPTAPPIEMATVGLAAGGGGRFLVTGSRQAQPGIFVLTYTVLDDHGAVLVADIPIVADNMLTLDVLWDGERFVIITRDTLYSISADGVVLDRRSLVLSPEVLYVRGLAIDGSVALFIRRLEKTFWAIHDGGIERYAVRILDPPRGRAIRR